MIEVEDLCMAWMNYCFLDQDFLGLWVHHIWMPTFYSEIPF